MAFLAGPDGGYGICHDEFRTAQFSEDNSTGMKIYFGFTVAGDRSTVMAARKIVGILDEMGHEVLTRHLVEENAWEADRSISPTRQGTFWGQPQRKWFYSTGEKSKAKYLS